MVGWEVSGFFRRSRLLCGLFGDPETPFDPENLNS